MWVKWERITPGVDPRANGIDGVCSNQDHIYSVVGLDLALPLDEQAWETRACDPRRVETQS